MIPLLVSSGEPAGIGPELCLALAGHALPIVVLGDKEVLQQRARQLGISISITEYHAKETVVIAPNHLTVLSMPCSVPAIAGQLDSRNAKYVLDMLTVGANQCASGAFSALITAPVQKSIINQAGVPFTGHTEFLADYFQVKTVVMMLVCPAMRVALVTTHLPLKDVSVAITERVLSDVLMTLNNAFQRDFGILNPKIYVAGLNPHAGEDGCLGREEIDIITPTLQRLHQQGIQVSGPFPADTLFTKKQAEQCDVFVAMYHDQGLSVIKYADFDHAVNVTLGLPIIRTSVDHGTAIDIAGKGLAKPTSLLAAVDLAAFMVKHRHDDH